MADFTVLRESLGCEIEMCNFNSFEEARKFCDYYDWWFEDENGFCWEMAIRDNRF